LKTDSIFIAYFNNFQISFLKSLAILLI